MFRDEIGCEEILRHQQYRDLGRSQRRLDLRKPLFAGRYVLVRPCRQPLIPDVWFEMNLQFAQPFLVFAAVTDEDKIPYR